MKVYDIVETDLAPKAVGTYSQGAIIDGTYYFSGQIGLDPKTMEMKDNFSEQLEQILKNVDGLLEATGMNRDNIFKTTIFLTDLGEFSKVNEAYNAYFSTPYPARSCVEVPALPKGALIEIEVMAKKV